MPGGDRTGPMGYGPLTGRGMGYCASPGGRRRGFQHLRDLGAPTRLGGRGWRHRYFATGLFGWERADQPPPSGGRGRFSPWTAADDLALLEDREARLEAELKLVRERMQAVRQEEATEARGE